jgi:DNA-binding transcriptional regulator YiaG
VRHERSVKERRVVGRLKSRGAATRPGQHLTAAAVGPEPSEIRCMRNEAGLTQTQAATLVCSTLRTWQDWEAGIARMHPGLWELFCLKVKARSDPRARSRG